MTARLMQAVELNAKRGIRRDHGSASLLVGVSHVAQPNLSDEPIR
jgi:hypothetical protein